MHTDVAYFVMEIRQPSPLLSYFPFSSPYFLLFFMKFLFVLTFISLIHILFLLSSEARLPGFICLMVHQKLTALFTLVFSVSQEMSCASSSTLKTAGRLIMNTDNESLGSSVDQLKDCAT